MRHRTTERRGDVINIPLTYGRDELIERLTAERDKAAKRDAKRLAAHQRDEAAYFKKFRKALADAGRWDYEEAKEHRFEARVNDDRGWQVHGPNCPISEASKIDELLAFLDKTSQDRFTISRDGKWHHIYAVLTADVPARSTVC
jgi:hypothetical protein